MTSGIIVLTNKGSGTTEESVFSGGDNDTLGFTLLASGTPVTKIEHRKSSEQRIKYLREALITVLL